jgi:hypothetical protein
MQEGANELLLRDERDGGGKRKRHVPHHSFAQRLYSKLRSYLASLANLNLAGGSARCGDVRSRREVRGEGGEVRGSQQIIHQVRWNSDIM